MWIIWFGYSSAPSLSISNDKISMENIVINPEGLITVKKKKKQTMYKISKYRILNHNFKIKLKIMKFIQVLNSKNHFEKYVKEWEILKMILFYKNHVKNWPHFFEHTRVPSLDPKHILNKINKPLEPTGGKGPLWPSASAVIRNLFWLSKLIYFKLVLVLIPYKMF